jgi:hypothetical protein
MVTRGSCRSMPPGRLKKPLVGPMCCGKFHDLQAAHKSLVATEALERAAVFYAAESATHRDNGKLGWPYCDDGRQEIDNNAVVRCAWSR